MSVTDPISDMLTRIRNALMVRYDHVVVPSSKMKIGIARILRKEGFIRDYEPVDSEQLSSYREDVKGQVLEEGITEAGAFIPGSIKSSIGLGALLLEGIGDTIRVSLSDDPIQEVKIGNEILKSLNLRDRGVKIIACPTCARQAFQVIDTVKLLEEKLSHIKTPLTLSIIGCVVNGPGEASQTDIGITGGGKGNHMLYLNGVQAHKITDSEIIPKIVKLVEKKASEIDNNK